MHLHSWCSRRPTKYSWWWWWWRWWWLW